MPSRASGALSTLELENEAVLKVQVHAGGRGKAGGVKLARTREEIEDYAKQILGMKIVNNQTGKQGIVAHTLMISTLVDVDKEYYLGSCHRSADVPRCALSPLRKAAWILKRSPKNILKRYAAFLSRMNGSIKAHHLLQLCKVDGLDRQNC